MNLKNITLNDFMCASNQQLVESSNLTDFDSIKPNLSGVIGTQLCCVNGIYFIHEISTGAAGDLVLVYEGKPVGCYWGNKLSICPDHQGKKLSVALILSAVEKRELPIFRTFSTAGKKCFEKAWNIANGKEECPFTYT